MKKHDGDDTHPGAGEPTPAPVVTAPRTGATRDGTTRNGASTNGATAKPVSIPGSKSGRPTMKMVAEAAGVSTATVSYVFSGRPGSSKKDYGVAEETRKRVTEAAEALGYQTNLAARAVRTGRSDLILLRLIMLADPWALEIAQSAYQRFADEEKTVLVLPDGDWRIPLEQHQIDVAFIDGLRDREAEAPVLTDLGAKGRRIIVFDERVEPDGFDVVRSDAIPGARLLMDYLLEKYPTVAALDGSNKPEGGRLRVYLDAVRKRGQEPVWVGVSPRDEADAFRGAIELLTRPDRPRAIYATADYLAIAVIHAAHYLGLSVPGDVAVAGLGNTTAGEELTPSLTSAGPERFVEKVIDRFHELATDADAQPGQLLDFPWRVFERDSA